MASEMMEALIALAQEKHIDELYLLDRLEQSLAKSYADLLHLDWGAKVTIDRQTGKVWVYRLEPVDDSMDEEGNYQEWEEIDVTPADTSRTAAQHAKAEINSIVRMAAREAIYEEFSKRVGELITGTVLQVTNDFTILKIREGVEAELPHFDRRRFPDEMNERPNGEYYQHNQRVRAVIVGVRDPKAVQNGTASRGEHNRPAIIVSRTHPDLIRRLFELEVPEVYEGIVEVKAVSREPGTRSKVAVASLEQHLDPVGACVGPKGTRVRTVVSELRGERIDVVLWDKDPAKYVANALSPAKVTRVLADTENQYATVIVPDDQLSLAIGKEGQNARLAARLTGWHIDIKNESLAANLMGNLHSLMDNDVDLSDEGRCSYVDEQGNRCRNQARPGTHFCSVHQASAGVADDFDSLI
ncbi:MAG: transcription termination factor NusA [Coriobacteriaceae bacterium]|nr:transcription termination factor NusA [Coriobacteriaceae bacterium]MDY5809484.1 transcription termination factor NusA [Coriobacteriales bacterium]